MLAECGEGGVQFDHAMQRCIACDATYQPNGEERQAVLARDAEAWLREKLKPNIVLMRLIEESGTSESEADTNLEAARHVLRKGSKQQGAWIASSGLVLLGIAAAVHLLTLGFRIAIGCLAFGIPMVLLGLLKATNGWNITGNDDG